MKRFIGLLSDEDAELLERYASNALRILEFGMGGSTHIFAQCLSAGASLTSVETDARWIARVRADLARLGFAGDRRITLMDHDTWRGQRDRAGRSTAPEAHFDLVFIDGAADLRRPFAMDAWCRIAPGGFLLVHDTRNLRVPRDLDTVLHLARTNLYEVDELRLNEKWADRPSNLSALRRKTAQPWVDWTKASDKPQWRFGRGEVPEDFWRGR